jgi:hypothetical protein
MSTYASPRIPQKSFPSPEFPPFFFLISHLKNAAPAVSLGSSKCYLEIWVLAPDFCLCENRAGESVSLSDVREWERVFGLWAGAIVRILHFVSRFMKVKKSTVYKVVEGVHCTGIYEVDAGYVEH